MVESMQQKCSQCKKMGIVRCDGCSYRFCSIHFNEHRQQLDSLFEQICNDRDTLCEKINNLHSVSLSNYPQINSLLNQVTEWEHKTLKMVKETADHARQQINELMTPNSKTTKSELDKFSIELRRRIEDVDYFEQDIEYLRKKLNQIQTDLNVQQPHIRINIISIDWSTILKVISNTSKCDVHQQINQLFFDGTLLNYKHQIQLNKFYGKENQKWKLIYKATRDGFDPVICHQCCDDQGPTLTIIQSTEGYLFGGFTVISWNKLIVNFGTDQTAFLFTLTNPHNILPTKYKINSEGKHANFIGFKTGPIFGNWDIFIYPASNKNRSSNIQFPSTYIDSTGKGKLTFTGSQHFSTIDIEMYRLVVD